MAPDNAPHTTPHATPLGFRARVVSVQDLTPRIRQVELAGCGAPLPQFEAGAHVELVTPSGLRRSYSIANDPAEHDRYLLAVLREPGGHGSGWMHDVVQAGDELDVAALRNAFPVHEEASEHILVAGGVGITPIRAMALHLAAQGARFRILYCTRSAPDTAFRDDLTTRHGSRLHLHHDGGDPARSLDLAAALQDRPAGAHLYVCGPRGMIAAARAAAAHWPGDAVHFELFASPPPPAQPASTVPPSTLASAEAAPAYAGGDQPFEVELARSGVVLHVPVGRSILEVILEAGVKAPYVCREGWCGNCRTVLLGGQADHRDDILEDDEKAAQDQIHVCISRALPGERLVLDR